MKKGLSKLVKNIIEIYIDGACSGNPGKGGYGIVLLLPAGQKIEVSEFMPSATSNQTELAAAIAALNLLPENLEDFKIKILSDSNYVVKGITSWINEWKENNWTTKRGPVRNKPMWEKLEALTKNIDIEWSWVKGHSDNVYNNRCDELAVQAVKDEKGVFNKID